MTDEPDKRQTDDESAVDEEVIKDLDVDEVASEQLRGGTNSFTPGLRRD